MGGLRNSLGHDGVLAPELGVDALEVVRARPEVLERTARLIRRTVVILLADLQFDQTPLDTEAPRTESRIESRERRTHLQGVDKLLTRDDLDAGEAVEEVHIGLDLGRVALDGDGPVARRAATAKREHRDALAADVRGRDGREQRREPAVERCGVHVPAPLRALHRRRDVRLVVALGERDKRLLQRLVRQRLCGRQRQQRGRVVWGDRGELWRGGVRDEVVVHLGVRLL